MKAKRWNYETRYYEPFDIPIGCTTLPGEGERKCPHCHKNFALFTGAPSLEIVTESLLPYMVCPRCYEEERRIHLKNCDDRGRFNKKNLSKT